MAKVHVIDFTNVKEGGGINPVRKPAGDYAAKIVEVRDEEVSSGDNAGTDMWNFVLQLVDFKSATYPYRCTLVENQFWKVRNILIAAGKTVPKSRAKVNPNNVIGKIIGITLDDDEYEGRPKSNVSAVFPASELEDEVEPEEDDEVEEEEEEEAPPPRRRAAKKAPAKKTTARSRKAAAEEEDEEDEDLDLDEL